jgi:phytoene desaturase
MAAQKKVVVVGGGLAGLAASVELAQRGAAVTLIEANQHLGGKMNVLEQDGYRFDMGPTILTLPEVLCGIIRRAGGKVSDYIDLVRLDPQWRCVFEDGTRFDLRDNLDDTVAEFDRVFPGSGAGAGFRKFVDYSRRMNRLSRKVFFYRDLGGVRDVMRNTPMGDFEVLKDALAMRMHSTVGKTIDKHVEEPHVRQMAEHFLQYVGSSPFLAPAILTMIASVQTDQGCWYARGGTRSVARALERLVNESGIEVHRGTKVTQILEKNGRAVGVVTDRDQTFEADAVVSNCDVQRTLGDLLGTPSAASRLSKVRKKFEPACSGIVFYWGLDRQYDQLAHHNFFFSRDSHAEFDDIYRKGVPAEDPTLYVAAPSRTEPDQAPPGGEALYILVHTAYLRDGKPQSDSEKFVDQYRPVVIEKLRRCGIEDVEQHIRVERTLTPSGIESMYNAEGGAIYGLASHGKLAGGFKPKNTSPAAEGLYLCGGSANPGPGVPMVLMSGVTAADAVARDLSLERPDLSATSDGPGPGEVAELQNRGVAV